MARIPQEEIDRLKLEVKLTDFMRRQGIDLARVGEDNLMARCPHHDDDTPSLAVSPSKNLWHCLGACGDGGDIIQWVMKSERCGFRRAVEILMGGEAERLMPLAFGDDDRSVKDVVTSYYYERLHAPSSPDGLAYLEQRGIRDEEFIDRFRIGFGDRTLGYRVPPKEYKAGRALREQLSRIGFFREATGREHFNGCVTFPIFDAAGEVAEVYGRKIRDDIRHKHGSHLYLPGPHRGVWNLEGIKASDGTVILCEALIDAATFWCAGFRNVTSAYGVNGFTSEMLDAFKAHGVRRVLIAYDRDEAGDKAADILALSLGREDIGAFRIVFPRFMDANDFARKVGPASQSLTLLVKSAEWLRGPKDRSSITLLSPAVVQNDENPTASDVVPEPVAAIDQEDEQEHVGGEVEKPVPSLAAVSVDESPQPEPPAMPDRSLAVSDYSTIDLTFGDRRYRIRGSRKT